MAAAVGSAFVQGILLYHGAQTSQFGRNTVVHTVGVIGQEPPFRDVTVFSESGHSIRVRR